MYSEAESNRSFFFLRPQVSEIDLYKRFYCYYGNILKFQYCSVDQKVWITIERSDRTAYAKMLGFDLHYADCLTVDWYKDREEDQIQPYRPENEHTEPEEKELTEPAEIETPPDIDSPEHILNVLPYDCLYDIIEVAGSDLANLFEISKVCSDFETICVIIFRRRFKRQQQLLDKHLLSKPLDYVERFLGTFGEDIECIDQKSVGFIGFIIQYCPNIYGLKCVVQENYTLQSLNMFSNRLVGIKIGLHGRHGYDLCILFKKGHSIALKSFEILHYSMGELNLPDVEMPILKMLYISGECVNVNPSYTKFFRKTLQLREFKIDSMGRLIGLNAILIYAAKLTTLAIGFDAENKQETKFTCFEIMQNLHQLEISILNGSNYYCRLLKSIISYGLPLKELKIQKWLKKNRQMIELLIQIPTILLLQTIFADTLDDLMKIRGSLVNLQQLIICSKTDFFPNIGDFLQFAHDHLKIMRFFLLLNYGTVFEMDKDECERVNRIIRRRGIDFRMYVTDSRVCVPEAVSFICIIDFLIISQRFALLFKGDLLFFNNLF